MKKLEFIHVIDEKRWNCVEMNLKESEKSLAILLDIRRNKVVMMIEVKANEKLI